MTRNDLKCDLNVSDVHATSAKRVRRSADGHWHATTSIGESWHDNVGSRSQAVSSPRSSSARRRPRLGQSTLHAHTQTTPQLSLHLCKCQSTPLLSPCVPSIYLTNVLFLPDWENLFFFRCNVMSEVFFMCLLYEEWKMTRKTTTLIAK